MIAKPPLRHEEVQRILGLLEPLSADRSIVNELNHLAPRAEVDKESAMGSAI